MAYVNVAEWKPDQVTEWLKGLDSTILPYIQSFLNNRISGQQILGFGPSDLEHLGIQKIGHQEVILEGIEHLRNIHYELDRENLQLLAMRLSCLSHSLHSELCQSHAESQRLTTQILADIANIVTCVKPLIAWLDRPGFSGLLEYKEVRSEVLKLGLRMAICGQRDRFTEAPVTDMKDASSKLAKLTDSIVQEMTDPLILQPASLELATIKKRSSDDLGFYIIPSFQGIHRISDLKLSSPAHQCGKIEPGDEIVQINYQTVVGWDVKQVMHLFAESPTEVLLTLKKRPKHTKVYGQIYVKPYRLPSKKRAIHSHGFPPRLEPLTRLHFRLPIRALKLPTAEKIEKPAESRDSSSSDEEVTVQHKLVVPSKPVQRRATITGVSPLSKRPPFDIHELWHDLKLEKESAIKQSATSVVDFEERLSSANKNNMQNLQTEIEPPNLETLSIKQKIQMFSREQTQERQKPPVRKQQIRINSEPIFDNKSLDEAVKMMKKTSTPVPPNRNSDCEERNGINGSEDRISVKSFSTEEVCKSAEALPSLFPPQQENHVAPERNERHSAIEIGQEVPEEKAKPKAPPPRLLPTFPEPPKEPYFEIPQSMKTHEELIKGVPMHLYREQEVEEPDLPPVVAPRHFELPTPKNEVSVVHSLSAYCDDQNDDDLHPPPVFTTNKHNGTVIAVNSYPEKSRQHNEEHGKIVQTINQHLLTSAFCDDSDLIECRSYGKNLDSGTSEKFRSSQSQHNLGHKNFDVAGGFVCVSSSSKKMECDSELSRTISRVNTEDIINNKEHIGSTKVVVTQKNSFPHQVKKPDVLPPRTVPKVSNIDKSYSNDSINRLQALPGGMASSSAMRSDVSLDSFLETSDPRPRDGKYSSLQEKHLRAAYKDVCDTFSTKSYSSSEYSEQSLATRSAGDASGQERQTLPKVGAKHTLIQAPPVPPPRPSLSKPPNACYRAIMAARSLGKASPKTQRKKNALLSKRRKVAVKDFSTVECDGWLLQRCRKGSGTWIKRWCLIHANTLYTFKAKSASKAETMVYLPGFTVSPAEEVKSRPFAFKVYHTGTMFYFAAETNFELSVWLDAISTATLEPNLTTQEVLYSESEGELPKTEPVTPESRKQPLPVPVATSSPNPPPSSSGSESGSKMFGSLKKLGRRDKHDKEKESKEKDGSTGGSSLDRKCLRILGTGPLPVPTAQYRSYRRVHNAPPLPPPSICPPNKDFQDQPPQQPHTALPPEMADYRLASLTAKTTPPVPRRRVVPREILHNENRRPHISAPILNPLPHGPDERPRMFPLQGGLEYRNHPPGEPSWIDSLRRSDNGRRKVKSKKHLPFSQAGPSVSHMHQDGAYGLLSPGATPTIPELEYPPVFEPGTYTLDTLLYRTQPNPHAKQ
ncbi:SAM domain (Sterile alpha motif) [Nesidiocoris tenuis]|uniref:SAM domain (Sterile alpha motif) n=1 Tax=Nesidiocoris tenuis TaxID=355587 RepID=A0ABN7B5I7_9HEMI|nr:SAM domain (Sterile alpha motif) [Nesidiocoris tenuis]